jgi:hypothetical protein
MFAAHHVQNRSPRKLTETELRGELERLEKELSGGNLSIQDAYRLKKVRKHLQELDDLKAGSTT